MHLWPSLPHSHLFLPPKTHPLPHPPDPLHRTSLHHASARHFIASAPLLLQHCPFYVPTVPLLCVPTAHPPCHRPTLVPPAQSTPGPATDTYPWFRDACLVRVLNAANHHLARATNSCTATSTVFILSMQRVSWPPRIYMSLPHSHPPSLPPALPPAPPIDTGDDVQVFRRRVTMAKGAVTLR